MERRSRPYEKIILKETLIRAERKGKQLEKENCFFLRLR